MQRFRVDRGDVLITKDSETPDDIGIASVVVDDIENLVCGYHVALLKPNQAIVDPVYLSKQLSAVETSRYFGRVASGSTRYGLTYRSIAKTPVRLAPLTQQRSIARLLTTLDDTIEETEALIAKTHQIKAGLMYDLFTRGVLPNGELRPPRSQAPQLYKNSSMGWVPEEWEVSDVASEFDITSGITLGPHRRPARRPHPYLRVANVYSERLDLHDIAFLEAGADVPGKRLAAGDLLVVEGHANIEEIGRCAMATSEVDGFTFQNHLFRLRSRSTMPAFGVRWLNAHRVRAYWRRTCSTSSGLNTINRTKLRAVPVILPSLEEQKVLCSILDHMSGQVTASREHLAKLRHLKRGLMHDLLTGRVRVPATLSDGASRD